MRNMIFSAPLLLLFSSMVSAQEIKLSGAIGADIFPSERNGAPDGGGFTKIKAEGSLPLGDQTALEFDTRFYGATHFSEAGIDPRVALSLDIDNLSTRLGFVRSQWGRTDESALSFLTSPNASFGYPSDLDDFSQPGMSLRYTFGASLAAEFTALAKLQKAKQLKADERLSYGLTTSTNVESNEMAYGLRFVGNNNGIDWALFGFTGLDRRPSYVAIPRLSGPEVIAHFDRVDALGFEVEATIGPARIWGEGARIFDSRNSINQRVDYTVLATGAELQWCGLGGRELDLIIDLRGQYDSREDKAAAPFQSNVGVGFTLLQTKQHPFTLEANAGFDLETDAQFWSVAGTKQISEDPFLNLKVSYPEPHA